MKSEKNLSRKEMFKSFLKYSAEVGSALFYLGIMMCLVSYHAYGIMGLCLFGLMCSLYNSFENMK